MPTLNIQLPISLAALLLVAPAAAQSTCASPGTVGVGVNTISLTAQNTGTQRMRESGTHLICAPDAEVSKVGWYRFVPPSTGWYSFALTPCDSSRRIVIWNGCPTAAGSGAAPMPLAFGCSVDATQGTLPLAQPLQAGTPYLVMVGNTSDAGSPFSGSITISPAPAPSLISACQDSEENRFCLGTIWNLDHLPPQRASIVSKADFSRYEAGPLVGQEGWQQFGTSGSQALQVASGRVVIPGGSTVDGQDAFKALPRQFSAPTGTTTQETVLNFDLVLTVSSAGANPSHFAALLQSANAQATGNSQNARIAARSSGSGFVLGTRVNGEAGYPYSFGTQVLAFGQQYAVRAEVHLNRGNANDFIKLYVGSSHANLALHATAGFSGSGTVTDTGIAAMMLSQNGIASTQSGVSIRSMGVSTDGGMRIGIRLGARSIESDSLVDVEVFADGESIGLLRDLGGLCLWDFASPSSLPMAFIDVPTTSYHAAIADRRLQLSFAWPALRDCQQGECCPSPTSDLYLEAAVWPGYADCDQDGTSDSCQSSPSSCALAARADIDGDGIVSGIDLGALLGAWGSADSAADLDRDGNVSGIDLGILLGAWGQPG